MFKIRTTKPEAGNKYYIRKANGGYSPCILGKPTDKDCNVLANCVGYVVGRFNEEINAGKIKYLASMNAENFFANAYKWNLKTGQEPKQGAIMCWAKGKPGVANDGAGHVAIVERVDNSNQVFTSESAYGGKVFYNKNRTKGSNGKWGMNSKYTFLGFIYNPEIQDAPEPVYYVVKKGDNLSSIAKKFNTTWQDIYNLNKSLIDTQAKKHGYKKDFYNHIYIGQKLRIK